MRIPTPDSLLVAATDAAFAVPQGRGVPLPAVMVATEFAPSVGAGLVGLTSVGVASGPLVACWAALTLAFGSYALLESRRLVADARGWDGALARSYRACALAMREGLPWLRAVFLMLAVGLGAVLAVFAAQRGIADPVTLNVGAYVCLAGGFLAMLLGGCAMPRDPDLSVPVALGKAAHP